MNPIRPILAALVLAAGLLAACATKAPPMQLSGVACQTPFPVHCPDGLCPGEIIQAKGPLTEPKTNANYFLDYPCDLRPGEKVHLILNLHGAGAPTNWHRHYFPASDYKDKYRLIVATPSATNAAAVEAIARSIIDQVGAKNIRSFWLAGHSAGGMASHGMLCNPFLADRVDGWLSLSGGYVGEPRRPAPPPCDYSHIYTVGEVELQVASTPLPEKMVTAERYGCGPRTRRPDIVDEKGGYVYDTATDRTPNPRRGGRPAPGTSEVYEFPGCRDGRVVAQVLRLKKGHAEGLEPKVTEALVKMMVQARGGKLAALAQP